MGAGRGWGDAAVVYSWRGLLFHIPERAAFHTAIIYTTYVILPEIFSDKY